MWQFALMKWIATWFQQLYLPARSLMALSPASKKKVINNNLLLIFSHLIQELSLIWVFQQVLQRVLFNAMNSHPICNLINCTLAKSPCFVWRKNHWRTLGLLNWLAFWKWNVSTTRPKLMVNNWCQARCCLFSPRRLSLMEFLWTSRMVKFIFF